MAFIFKIIDIFYIIPHILVNPKRNKELLAGIFLGDKKHLVLKETKEHSDSNKEINSDAEKKQRHFMKKFMALKMLKNKLVQIGKMNLQSMLIKKEGKQEIQFLITKKL